VTDADVARPVDEADRRPRPPHAPALGSAASRAFAGEELVDVRFEGGAMGVEVHVVIETGEHLRLQD
jgi:hypothetical protein